MTAESARDDDMATDPLRELLREARDTLMAYDRYVGGAEWHHAEFPTTTFKSKPMVTDNLVDRIDAALAQQSEPTMNIDEACAEGNAEAAARRKSQNWIDLVVRDICEIPYRSSPGDQPNMMLVTPQELRNFIEQHAPPSAAALIAKRDAEIDQLRTRNEYLSQLMREPEQQQAFRAEAAERALAELEQIWHDIGAICASGWTRDNEARSPNEWAEALLYERDELREKLQAAERTLAKATSTLATISGYLYPEEVVLGGPHCWPFRSVGDPEEVCEGCGITRRAARIRAKLLRLPHGHVTVTKTPAKKWTKLRLVVNNR